MVPNGWKKCSISEVAEVVTGSTPSTFDQNNYGSEYPFVSPTDLGLTKIVTKTQKYLSGQGFKASRPIPKGSALFTCIGSTIGKVGVAGTLLTTNQQINAVIPKEIDHDYLYYALCQISPRVKRLAGVQAVPIVNKSSFENEIIYAPISEIEQRQIAAILSTWDEAIEKTERLIEGKEKRFKWLVKSMIFSPAAGDKSWAHLRIRDIAERVQRRSSEEYPILTISSASGFALQEEKYSRYMAGESVKNYILLRRGEFAYNKGNSLRYQFGCIFELKDYEAALVPHVYVCFKLHDGINASYLSHVFSADYLKPQLGAIVKTGVRNNGLLNIKPDEFMSTTVPIPSINMQKKIADALNTARQEIDLLKRQVEAYSKQKRGLMQKLLTGEWRVKVG